jgi:1-pyrroline-5-carboxylate dehydrogenase
MIGASRAWQTALSEHEVSLGFATGVKIRIVEGCPGASSPYSNIAADFTPLHDWLDQAMRAFRLDVLGRAWPNVVGGRQDVSGRAYEVYCPFDRDILVARLVEADRKTIRAAIEAARAAFPGWSERPYADRVTAMRQFARELERRKYLLAMAAMFEVGKSRLEAVGEAEEAVDLVDWYCDELERNRGFERPMSRAVPREETVCRLRPVGTFAVIAPFNFPVALACNMLGACLLAGNTAVFKPSPGAGLTAALILGQQRRRDCRTASSTSSAAGDRRCWSMRQASTGWPSRQPRDRHEDLRV